MWKFPNKETKNLVAYDIRESIDTSKTLAFKKDSELTALFNHHVMKLMETGVNHKIMSGMSGSQDHIYGISDAVVMGFENLLFPFAWLAFGFVLVVPIIFGEMLLRRYKSFRGITIYGHHSKT